MAKDKKKKTEDKAGPSTGAPGKTGRTYVCICAHDEPFVPEGGGRGFRPRKVGEVEVFDKNPGPYWRLEKDIKKTKEVTDNGTAD
jgi:hypothetical protein